MKGKAEESKKNKKIQQKKREGDFLLLAILIQTGNTLLTLMVLTDIYMFAIMAALGTSQRKGKISNGGRWHKENLLQKELAEM